MASLTKAQIEYFKGRFKFIERKMLNEFEEKIPKREWSNEEKAGQILRGKAKLREGIFDQNTCPGGNFFSFWVFTDNGAYVEFNEVRSTKLGELDTELEAYGKRFMDEYVFENDGKRNPAEEFEVGCREILEKHLGKFGEVAKMTGKEVKSAAKKRKR